MKIIGVAVSTDVTKLLVESLNSWVSHTLRNVQGSISKRLPRMYPKLGNFASSYLMRAMETHLPSVKATEDVMPQLQYYSLRHSLNHCLHYPTHYSLCKLSCTSKCFRGSQRALHAHSSAKPAKVSRWDLGKVPSKWWSKEHWIDKLDSHWDTEHIVHVLRTSA